MPYSFSDRSDEFHQRAIQQCGWSDFGNDDYLPALQVLLASLDSNPPASEVARLSIEQMITGPLLGRLYSEHYKNKHPEFAATPLKKPIFIIGLPRSGTTALHKLLSADPENQSMSYWLGQTPMPRPAEQGWPDYKEYQSCAQQLGMMAAAAPEIEAIHSMVAGEADECRLLLMQNFANVTFSSNAWVPEYESWLYGADFSAVYSRYRENLQLIGLGDSRRWVLKDPSHLWSPSALLEAFPDACIVQTHRQPEKLIPSVSSLVYNVRKLADPDIDKQRIGRRELQQWSTVLNNMSRFRRSNPQLPVYDIDMADLQRKPLETVEKMYQYFDIEFSGASREALRKWSSGRPPGVHGTHHYSAEEFGLSATQINSAFDGYIEFLASR